MGVPHAYNPIFQEAEQEDQDKFEEWGSVYSRLQSKTLSQTTENEQRRKKKSGKQNTWYDIHMLIPSTGEVVAGRQWAKSYLYSLNLMRYSPNKLKIDEMILLWLIFCPVILVFYLFLPKI